MRVTKQVKVPQKTVERLDHIKCELCDRTTHNEEWSPGQYEVTRPEVSLRMGTNYPEGGNVTETVLDICPTCFQEKLVPWFRSLGGEPRQEEHDW